MSLNIFAYELKAQGKSFLIWTASLTALLVVLMSAFFGMFLNARSAVEAAIQGLPPMFAAIFGVQMDRLFSYGGYYQFIYTYLAVVGAIFSSLTSLTVFSREKRSRCLDFLLTKPISRTRVFGAKFAASALLIALSNIPYLIAAFACYRLGGQDPSGTGRMLLSTLSLFFMELVFLAIGACYAAFARKVRSVSGVATAIGFAGFLLMALHSLLREEFLRFLSPLNYFDPGAVYASGRYEARYVAVAAVVFACSLAAAYVRFIKSDAQAI